LPVIVNGFQLLLGYGWVGHVEYPLSVNGEK
jgi:hypothetical protein